MYRLARILVCLFSMYVGIQFVFGSPHGWSVGKLGVVSFYQLIPSDFGLRKYPIGIAFFCLGFGLLYLEIKKAFLKTGSMSTNMESNSSENEDQKGTGQDTTKHEETK